MAEPVEARWLVWGRSGLALATVALLAALGVANIVAFARSHQVEDGVLWGTRSGGVTAVDLATGSAAERAGLERGDVVVAINGAPVRTPSEVIEYQHAGGVGTQLTYTVVHLGASRTIDIVLAPMPRGNSMYFVLAAVGLFTLVVGASVRLRRPRDQATLHFFWLSVVFFGAFTFSFNGPFDRLDWIFYWGDALATALLPPLLLHFTLVFPERPTATSRSRLLVPLIYLPAAALAVVRILAMTRGFSNGPRFSRLIDLLDRAELVYVLLCAVAAFFVLARAFREITSVTAERQLRWIWWGTALGLGPFALGYALPWALGGDPPFALQLTAIPLGLMPLTFACAIVRYRLRDVEVIAKRGLVYAVFGLASLALYTAMLKATGFAFANDSDSRNWVIALLSTAVVVLIAQPVREALQNALDRLFFYRDRYDYRRALVAFARDLNSDLDIVRLSQRLVSRVVETLVIDRMALMLADERSGDFEAVGSHGFTDGVPRLERASSFLSRLDAGRTVALDDPIAAARFAAEEVEAWRDAGIYYFVPCVFEGGAIAVLALGRKADEEPFNSEDLALLTAVAGQVATAMENGRLYRQLHVKAAELGRMREFNENILESLDSGLAVFDVNERIVRWNRALEEVYGVGRDEAVGRTLGEVFDAPFVEALAAARHEYPHGATLHRVPLVGRKGEDGQASRMLVNATEVPLQDPGNTVGGVGSGTILLVEDVTDRVRLEEQLQISEKMASIGVLAAGVAHEVNTPLTGISSYTQMLLEGADRSDPKTALLEKIEKQSFRAAKIVTGLLNLSRPGGTGNEHIDVDLNAVISDVFSLIEHQFEVGRVKIRRELAPSEVMVVGAEQQLQQVFLNLFLNARDAMPKGGWLSVSTRVEHDRVVAEVADTGSGIPSEHLARIYDPFFTTKAPGRGTGLGLSITYGIVQEHQGTIRCDSAIGQGTRFTLTLPRAAAEGAHGAAQARM